MGHGIAQDTTRERMTFCRKEKHSRYQNRWSGNLIWESAVIGGLRVVMVRLLGNLMNIGIATSTRFGID